MASPVKIIPPIMMPQPLVKMAVEAKYGVGGLSSKTSLAQKAEPRLRGLAGVDAAEQLRSGNLSEKEKMQMAAKQFEAILVQQMLKAMRATIPEGGVVKKNSAEKMFQEVMDQQLATDMSSSFGLGLSDAIVRQLSQARIPSKKGGQTNGVK